MIDAARACERCGAPAGGADLYCGHCGQPLARDRPRRAREEPPKALPHLPPPTPPTAPRPKPEPPRRPPPPSGPGLGPPRPVGELLFELGRALVESGRPSEGVGALRRALDERESAPDRWMVEWHLAQALEQLGSHDESLRAQLEAIMLAPDRAPDLLPGAHRLLSRDSAQAFGDWIAGTWARHVQDGGGDVRLSVELLLARVSLYRDDYLDARERFQAVTEMAPEDVRGWEGLGESIWRVGDVTDGIATLQRARGLAIAQHDDERRPVIEAKLAQALSAAGRHKDALEFVSAHLEEDHRCAYALLVTGSRSYLAEAHFAEAVEAARRAQALHPDDVEPMLIEVRALLAAGDMPAALAAADRAAALRPDDPATLLIRAQALVASQDDAELVDQLLDRFVELAGGLSAAVVEAQEILGEAPEDFGGAFVVAELRRRAGLFDEALADVDRALAISPSDAQRAAGANLKGRLLDLLDDPEAADWFLTAGRTHIARMEYRAAIAPLRRAVEISPGEPDARWELADALRLHSVGAVGGEAEAAASDSLAEWVEGAKLQPPGERPCRAYLIRGLLQERLNELGDEGDDGAWAAAAWFEQALLVEDRTRTASLGWAYVARTYRALELFATASDASARALETDPDSVAAREACAADHADEGRLDEALEEARALYASGGGSWSAYLVGFALLRLGRAEEAAQAMEQMGMPYHDDPWQRLDYGFALMHAGREQQGRDVLEELAGRARELRPEDRDAAGWAAWALGRAAEVLEADEAPPATGGTIGGDHRILRGACLLTAGDAAAGTRCLVDGIAATTTVQELEHDLPMCFEVPGNPLRDWWLAPDPDAARLEVARAIEERQAALAQRDPESELRAVAATAAEASEPPWAPVAVHLALARRLYESGRSEDAVAEWRLLAEPGADVDELAAGLRTAAEGLSQQAYTAQSTARPEEAVAALALAAEVQRLAGDDDALALALGELARAQLLGGAQEEAAETATTALELGAAEPGGHWQAARLHAWRGYARLRAGDGGAWTADLRAALDAAEADGNPSSAWLVGEALVGVVPDVDAYWALDALLARNGRELDREDAVAAARAGLRDMIDQRYAAPDDESLFVVREPPVPLLELRLPAPLWPDRGRIEHDAEETRERLSAGSGVSVPAVTVSVRDELDRFEVRIEETVVATGAATDAVIDVLEAVVRRHLGTFVTAETVSALAPEGTWSASAAGERALAVRTARALAEQGVKLVDPAALDQALRAVVTHDAAPAERLARARALLGEATSVADPIPAALEARIAAVTGVTAAEPLLAGPTQELDAIAGALDAEAARNDGTLALRDPLYLRTAWLLVRGRRPGVRVLPVAADAAALAAAAGVERADA